MSEENGLTLLKQEMSNEEIHIKVNAVHRMSIVIASIGDQAATSQLLPYLDELCKTEDDEVLFAIAEELGKCYTLLQDKTAFLSLLEMLCKANETVVREEATKSLVKISELLTDADVHNVFAPLVVKLAQMEFFTGRSSSCSLFTACYSRAGPQKEKLRKKFIELCNEDTPMIRRACAQRLGEFATQLDKQHVLQEILPIFRQLSQDEQDTIRVLCLESLIPMASVLSDEENQIHTLGTLLAAGEDKSWKVRLAFARNFSLFSKSFGSKITDANLIQTFTLLLQDTEPEVKLAACQNIPGCLSSVSDEKIQNLLLPTLQNSYVDANFQYKAATAVALEKIAAKVGKDGTQQKIIPILNELIKEDTGPSNSEVRLNVVMGIRSIAYIMGTDIFDDTKCQLFKTFLDLISDKSQQTWRLRMAVFEQIAELAIDFGQNEFAKHLEIKFMTYLSNTAAAVRNTGVQKSAALAAKFGQNWVNNQYIPAIIQYYKLDKKGYNYRMCCLNSLAAVMPYTSKEVITKEVVPILIQACKDDIPNVKFCVAKVIAQNMSYIDQNVYSNQLKEPLKEMMTDKAADKDVSYFAALALKSGD